MLVLIVAIAIGVGLTALVLGLIVGLEDNLGVTHMLVAILCTIVVLICYVSFYANEIIKLLAVIAQNQLPTP